jgi:type II secretory pathway component PulF
MSIGIWLAAAAFKGTRQEFYEDLAEALKDGAQLAARIEQLADRASNEGDLQAPLFQLWLRRMDDQSFSDAVAGTVPDSDLMILQAAERSGDLATGLEFTATVIEKTQVMVGALRKAVAGFVFLTVLQIAILVGFSFYGIPLINEIVPPNAWPWIGQQLKGLASFVTESGGTALACGAVLAVAYFWSLRNWYGRARVAVDRYALPYTIYRDFSGAMFLVSLAALMKNGTGLNDALDTLSERASPWLLWHIRQVQLGLDYQSESTGEAFATGLFDRRLTWRIIDFGERSGSDFALAMEKVGIKTIDKVMESVKAKAATINKFLMLVNGGLLMFIIAGSLLTMFEAQEQLQRQISSNQAAAK